MKLLIIYILTRMTLVQAEASVEMEYTPLDIKGGRFIAFAEGELQDIQALTCAADVDEFRNSDEWKGAVIMTLFNPPSGNSWQISYFRRNEYDIFTTTKINGSDYLYRNVLGKIKTSNEVIRLSYRQNEFDYYEFIVHGSMGQFVSVVIPESLAPETKVSVTLSGVKGKFLCWEP